MKPIEIKDNIFRAPMDSIKPNPWNPNEQTDFVFEKEKLSIQEHGFLDPITVRELPDGSYQIIDGEHRWKAMKAMSQPEILINNLGNIPEKIARKLTILANELRGRARRDKMSELLQSLSKDFSTEELYQSLPMQTTEIDSLINAAQINWDQVGGSLKGASDAPAGEPKGSKNSSQSSGSMGPDTDGQEKFREVKFYLPDSVAEQLEAQVDRVKSVLHPGEEPKDCSPVLAIECITQHIAQIPNEQLVG